MKPRANTIRFVIAANHCSSNFQLNLVALEPKHILLIILDFVIMLLNSMNILMKYLNLNNFNMLLNFIHVVAKYLKC
jgi:hypothetical protein